ncbi:MAG: ATP synthase F1 subunit epsilon [Deltaproteobacteria bacterium]|nr:ATP synthase F1 subunit epsilon [Deltaproteobacteria bacterium]
MKTLQLDIVTPSRAALSVVCKNVYIPAEDGEMGILESHESYVTLMGTGIVRIQKEEASESLCVRGGFIEVSDDQITLLADEVKFAREIDPKTLPAEMTEVDQKLATSQDSAILQAQLLDEKKWLQAQLDLQA